MSDPTQPLADRCFGTEVITCPECGHGIDPHGTEPGGICGVSDATGKRCECLMQPNGIAYARIAELETERDADRIADEFGIKSLSVENGVPTLAIEPTTEQARELVLAMSLACGRMLDDDQAPNYVEFEVSPANQLGYIVHVRRAGGPTPHTLRREAEDRAEQAEARIAELETERGQLAERVEELAAQRNPDDEVMVEGSWFHPADLPRILGNYMRGSAEDGRKWKDAVVALEAANRRIAELEQVTQYATERTVAAESKLDAERADYAGWRPPARVIETAEELDAIDWPCAVREITPKGELEFFPEIWESPFQTDGWNRYGRLFDEDDCTPRLPVEVLPEPIGGDR